MVWIDSMDICMRLVGGWMDDMVGLILRIDVQVSIDVSKGWVSPVGKSNW